jgi:nucleotide-binding universal stress UspA family protein
MLANAPHPGYNLSRLRTYRCEDVMSEKKILLGLDGSAQSRYAAELAWAIAKSGEMRVDAQHVVDSLAAWDFLAFDIAGFIGSGPYFEAHETMRTTLHDIGQNLIDVYRSLAQQNGIEGEAYLDEGTTIREICHRAKDTELVVLGQRSTGMQSPDEDQRKIPRRSVAESLTHYCPVPLLVVQDRCKPWTKMRIMLSSSAAPLDLVRECVEFAKKHGMEPSARIVYTESGSSTLAQPNSSKVVAEITKFVKGLSEKQVDVRTTSDINEYWKTDAEEDPETLLVIPVTEVGGIRRTPFGTTPDFVVRYLNHPAVLFWMHGMVEEQRAESEKSVSSAV